LGLCADRPGNPAAAHQSFAAEYDGNKKITSEGVSDEGGWMNPHARFYVDVKDESGKVTTGTLSSGRFRAAEAGLEKRILSRLGIK